MENIAEQNNPTDEAGTDEALFDYSFVDTVGRIALYDDLRSAPRILEVSPAETSAYIEALAAGVYEQARGAGGAIPYSVIREVSENFIHARFKEVVVSILDEGNTIRFADHGPGIPAKEKAQKPGFTSATDPMKRYIRGVGSGLPLVRDYMESFRGTITIEDNLGTGAVVTVSLVPDTTDDSAPLMRPEEAPANVPAGQAPYQEAPAGAYPAAAGYATPGQGAPYPPAVYGAPAPPSQGAPGYPAPYPSTPAAAPTSSPYGAGYNVYPAGAAPYGYAPPAASMPPLSEREERLLKIFLTEGTLGVSDMAKLTDLAPSSVYSVMGRLEEAGLITQVGKKRTLTPYGEQIARALR